MYNRIIYIETIFYYELLLILLGEESLGKRVFLGGGVNLPENGPWQVLEEAKCLKMDIFRINSIV